jgi:hypothetical protein
LKNEVWQAAKMFILKNEEFKTRKNKKLGKIPAF